jgi:hypothetical protein
VKFYWLILGILTVWRITHFLNAEDGPGDISVRLRRAVGEGFFGVLLDCFYCLSLWVAAPIAVLLAEGWKECVLLWLALSSGASVIRKLTENREQSAHSDDNRPAIYYHAKEDQVEEERNDVLR